MSTTCRPQAFPVSSRASPSRASLTAKALLLRDERATAGDPTFLAAYSGEVMRVRTVLAAQADTEVCRSAQEAIEFVGRRWVAVVLIAGYLVARRFTEYRRLAAGISDRVLSQRLRELEQRGLLERTVTPTTPVQITYTPTARGTALVRALAPLAAWWLESSGDDVTKPAYSQ